MEVWNLWYHLFTAIIIWCEVGGLLGGKCESQHFNSSHDPDSWGYFPTSIFTATGGKMRELLLNMLEPLTEHNRVERSTQVRFNGPSSNTNSFTGGSSGGQVQVQGQTYVQGPGPGQLSLYYAYPPISPGQHGVSGSGPGIGLGIGIQPPTLQTATAADRVMTFHSQLQGQGAGLGEKYYSEEQKEALLQTALDSAWEQYGPKTKQRIENIQFSGTGTGTGTGSVQQQQQQQQPAQYPLHTTYTHRDTSGAYAYNPNNGFQPWQSEWDTHVTALPPPGRPAMEPSFFNRLMASYIDFEVNNHEMADFLRRAVAVGFIGLVIVAWVGLGIYLGLFPLKWLYFLGVGRKRDAGDERLDHGGGGKDQMGNDLMTEITDRIFLALDGDWLRKLEERVTNDESRNWLKTHVQCCILPDAKTKGMADCQLVRRGKKDSTFKCLSDLIYNFQFNPTSSPPPAPAKSSSGSGSGSGSGKHKNKGAKSNDESTDSSFSNNSNSDRTRTRSSDNNKDKSSKNS